MRSKKPLIGITANQVAGSATIRRPTRYRYAWLADAYCRAVFSVGGAPVILPNIPDKNVVDRCLDGIDGLILSGGGDIAPKYYGQKNHPTTRCADPDRDKFEFILLERALKKKLPILCICRGHQLLNVFMGGTLYQDISLYSNDALVHSDPKQTNRVYHRVRLLDYSILRGIISAALIETNSSHHQAVDKTGKGLIISALSPDGVVEGLELEGYPALLSVQWHPERIFSRQHSRRLFRAFIEFAKSGK